MSLFHKMKMRSMVVAIGATACTAGFALQSAPQADAMPLAGVHQAQTLNLDTVIEKVRVIRKVRPGAGKTVRRPGRIYAPSNGKRQVVVVNGKRVVRPIGPVINDHRAPNPARRVPYKASVRR
jgi:hypothetical protein